MKSKSMSSVIESKSIRHNRNITTTITTSPGSWTILTICLAVLTQYWYVTDRQMDGWTDETAVINGWKLAQQTEEADRRLEQFIRR